MTQRALVLAVLFAGASAQAQAVRVRVTDSASAQPLAGVLVDALDVHDAVAAQGVSGPDGARLLRLPAAGSYRIRIRRIGFQPYLGAPVSVPAGSTVDVAIRAPERRVVLASIRVVGRRCSNDAFDDPSLRTLWDEVRTALTTTMLSRADSAVVLEVRAFHRTLDASGNVTEQLVGLPRITSAPRPYVALSPADLSRNGYVRTTKEETDYHGPDEQVLLSDEFLADHCFEVVRGTDATEGLLGVHFTPTDGRKVADIAGTLWVDSSSAQLRYLDFWYEQDGLPAAAHGEGRTGGQVVFVRTLSGMWIVGAWRLRLPRINKQFTLRSYASSSVTTVGGYEEIGGVLRGPTADSLPPSPVLIPYLDLLAPARITGTVHDSLTNRPMNDARIWLIPSEPKAFVDLGLAPASGRLGVGALAARPDSLGHFALDGIPAGAYRLAIEDPALDTLGVPIPHYEVMLKPGAHTIADVGVPSRTTLWTGCARQPGLPPSRDEGLLVGTVRSARDQRPLENALVRATWTTLSPSVLVATHDHAVEARTDADGAYRICGLPDSTFTMVQAAGPHSTTGRVSTIPGAMGIVRVDLHLAEGVEGEPPIAAGVVAGTVTDTLGHPIANAQLVFDGLSAESRTDSAGRFRVADVMSGTQTLEVRRVGLDPARRVVEVLPGATTTLTLTLTKTQLLEAMLITAQRNRRSADVNDAIRRHRTGNGSILLEEDIAHKMSIQSLLQGIPGVRVAQGQGSTPWLALMRKNGGECVARVFVDGHENDYDFLSSMSPSEIAAVEVFPHGALAPIFTAGRSPFGRDEQCGVLLFWLKH